MPLPPARRPGRDECQSNELATKLKSIAYMRATRALFNSNGIDVQFLRTRELCVSHAELRAKPLKPCKNTLAREGLTRLTEFSPLNIIGATKPRNFP